MLSINRILGGILLVAGTCIGAGMLGLPVATAAGGFYPSMGAFIFCWFMMMTSALLMLEVSLWYPEETNFITMAKSTLGRKGEIIAWCTYVLFLYAIMTAYTVGATGIVGSLLGKIGFHERWGVWSLVLLFAAIVYCGVRTVDWINRLLMAGLVGAYVLLIGNVLPHVSSEMLSDGNPRFLWSAGPLLVTSFGFHLLIPSLKNYLHSNIKALRLCIVVGSLLPLIVYLLWELLILGMIPTHGESGLLAIREAEMKMGKHVVVELTQLLTTMIHSTSVTWYANIFGLCALLTSFIGVAIGLFDFFADGFHIKKTAAGKLRLAALTFIPPILLAIFYPRFLVALRYAGIFAAILLVIFPAVMVWRGRYRLQLPTFYRAWGGKPLIIVVFLFGIGVIALEVLEHSGVLPEITKEKTNVSFNRKTL